MSKKGSFLKTLTISFMILYMLKRKITSLRDSSKVIAIWNYSLTLVMRIIWRN